MRRPGIGDHGSRSGDRAADGRGRSGETIGAGMAAPTCSADGRDGAIKRQDTAAPIGSMQAEAAAAERERVRVLAIHALCRHATGTERCFFPACNGCGIDRIVAARRRPVVGASLLPASIATA
jgi:hypothetical protein